MAAQGWRIAAWVYLAALLGSMVAGCSRFPGAPAVPSTLIAPTHLDALTLGLGDIPSGFRLVVDQQLTNAQLATQLGAPNESAVLAGANRTGGIWRLFVYSQPEPTTLNATIRATVSVDLFATPGGANQWFDQRLTAIRALPGTPLAAPGPGQRHAIQVEMYHTAVQIASTTATMAFVEDNATVEISTTYVGQGVSLADVNRYADLIDARLRHPPAP